METRPSPGKSFWMPRHTKFEARSTPAKEERIEPDTSSVAGIGGTATRRDPEIGRVARTASRRNLAPIPDDAARHLATPAGFDQGRSSRRKAGRHATILPDSPRRVRGATKLSRFVLDRALGRAEGRGRKGSEEQAWPLSRSSRRRRERGG